MQVRFYEILGEMLTDNNLVIFSMNMYKYFFLRQKYRQNDD